MSVLMDVLPKNLFANFKCKSLQNLKKIIFRIIFINLICGEIFYVIVMSQCCILNYSILNEKACLCMS